MTPSHARLIAAAIMSTAVLDACQSLADEHTSAPPLASMHGTLSLAPGMEAPQGDIRLAILWEASAMGVPLDPNMTTDPSSPCAVDPSKLANDPTYTSGYAPPEDLGYAQFRLTFAEQHLELETSFPVQFMLNITTPPPKEALHDVPGAKEGSLHARGQLIVYRDGNANGKLDSRTFARPSPDQILAASDEPGSASRYTIEYVNRKVEPDPKSRDSSLAEHSGFLDLEAGYNLTRSAPPSWKTERVATDTSIPIELSANPYEQRLLCEQWCQRPDDFVCPVDPADLPGVDSRAQYDSKDQSTESWHYYDGSQTYFGDEGCYQSPSGTYSYEWYRSTCEGCMCTQSRCNYQSDTLPEGATLPCSAYAP